MTKSEIKNKLIQLYNASSKHSNYQILASNFHEHIPQTNLNIQSRYEKERWDYITATVDFTNKSILDIGGNTGFFTFEAFNRGARHIDYYEGNPNHASFVSLSACYFDLNEAISVHSEYFRFDQSSTQYDITFLLNVLHHFGDDYGYAHSMEFAKTHMLDQLNQIAFQSRQCVFQMGYNWKGNRDACLFANGLKQEQIDWLSNGIRDHWDITHIGIAVKTEGCITYESINQENIKRYDAFGEFLNRPLFILKSKHLA